MKANPEQPAELTPEEIAELDRKARIARAYEIGIERARSAALLKPHGQRSRSFAQRRRVRGER